MHALIYITSGELTPIVPEIIESVARDTHHVIPYLAGVSLSNINIPTSMLPILKIEPIIDLRETIYFILKPILTHPKSSLMIMTGISLGVCYETNMVHKISKYIVNKSLNHNYVQLEGGSSLTLAHDLFSPPSTTPLGMVTYVEPTEIIITEPAVPALTIPEVQAVRVPHVRVVAPV